jgi:hypothetical protein
VELSSLSTKQSVSQSVSPLWFLPRDIKLKKQRPRKVQLDETRVLTEDNKSKESGDCAGCWLRKLQDDNLPASVVKRRCRFARTSVGGREKADIIFGGGDRGVWDENEVSTGGERGDGNRSSSRRSPKPFLKVIFKRKTRGRTDQSYTRQPHMSASERTVTTTKAMPVNCSQTETVEGKKREKR